MTVVTHLTLDATCTGEVYASPVGLSFVTKSAPKELVSALMGCWFLGSAAGGYLAGELGAVYGQMKQSSFFLLVTALGLINGALMSLAVPFINRWIDGTQDQTPNDLGDGSGSGVRVQLTGQTNTVREDDL